MSKILSLLFLFFTLSMSVMAQERKVSGVVVDEKGIGVVGATITVPQTNVGTASNENGEFSIALPSGKNSIEVSAIGMVTKSLIVGNDNTVRVVLSANQDPLDEVVVTAYGRQVKKAVTGSITGINAKDIEKRAQTSVTGVLEGQAPGTMVNNTYGQPGSTPSIRIRGFTSVNGVNSPLYVVDGVIFEGSVADLNANDVEDVSVLKDAAAASLYGSRAANGVVVISTKRAKTAKPTFNAIVNQGIYNRGLKEYKTMSPDQYMETMWLGYRNNLLSTNPTLYPTVAAANAKTTKSLIADNVRYNIYNKSDSTLFDANGKLVSDAAIREGFLGDLDWFSPIVQTGHRQDYNMNGGSRTDKSSLYFASGYLDEKGFMKRSRFQRFNGRVNADITPVKWFKTGILLNGTHQINNQYTDGNTSFNNPIYNARIIAPVFPVYLHDMKTGDYLLDADGNKIYDDGAANNRGQYVARHAIWENELNMDRTFRNTLQGQIFADVKFLKDFTLSVRADMNTINTERQSYDNALVGDGQGNKGRASRTLYRYKIYTFQQHLNWNRSFGDHNFDVLAGHENYNYHYSYLYGYKTTETFTGQKDLINFTNITSLTDYQQLYRTESYLSRARYNYDQRYFLEASFRRDGSSRFHPDNRWGNFWSVAGSWLLTGEEFMKNIKAVNDLKFRASYGQVGNDQSAGRYAHMALYTMDQNANVAALYKTQNAATDIIWETTESWGAALEGRLFKRLNFIAEYFDKRSVDLLFNVNLPLSAGATNSNPAEAVLTKNLGVTSNRGWEFSLDVDVVKNADFRLNVGANATLLKNRVVKLPEENRKNGIIDGTKKYMEGHGVYDFWLFQFAGVDQMTGNALYLPDTETYNGGDPSVTGKTVIPTNFVVKIGDKYYTTNTTYARRDWSGSAIPDVWGGFTLKADWKNLSFSGLFTYSLGSKIMDYSYQDLMSMSGSAHSLHTDLLKSWNGVPAGMTETSVNRIDPNGVPVVDYSRSQYTNATSNRFLQDGSYAVIKNIAVSYRLPKRILNQTSFSSCMLNFTIENLKTFTKLQGMDPQQSFNGLHYNYFMTPRVFSFGINLGL